MYGIDEQRFETMISQIARENNEVNSSIAKMKTATELVASIFRENDLGNINQGITKINNNNKKIYNQTVSYENILRQIKAAYQNQEQEISASIKHASTDL